ncbi:MAG: YcxB family protein [Oscillospiraceae bacterium]|nr:YcxB family protein [Oscillospiraceae bacterium]
MEFRCETKYDKKSLTALARGLRKTSRNKHSRRAHIFGWIVAVLGTLLIIKDFSFDAQTVVSMAAVLAILIVFIWEDRINGAIAGRRILPGLKKSSVVFREDSYSSETELGKSEFTYDHIIAIAELPEHFVFIFSKNHGQVYDKKSLEGGTAEEFRAFLEEVTGKQVQTIR